MLKPIYREYWGVYKTEVGYANREHKNPTYEEVCNFDTKHAECVKSDLLTRFHIPKRVIGRIK